MIPKRCAIYTRKSVEEGLEQEFNSLDAQRTAGENYIKSQQHEGWILLPQHYDDGGYSGGTLERPALRQLFEDIKASKVDCVVVYKIDRMSRSLADFMKIIELFDQHKVSFVSVTQSFNTATSMGRLMLNVLLSFAQYERELTGERIRDKFALSRQKGMWMGGSPPLGYDICERHLMINEQEAALVYFMFKRFTQLKSITKLVRELNNQGAKTKYWISRAGEHYGGKSFKKSSVRDILRNPLYIGQVVHKGVPYPGQHKSIVELALWQQAQSIFQEPPKVRARATIRTTPAPLQGIIWCGECAAAMTPTHTKKEERKYRYYMCSKHYRSAESSCEIRRVPAGEIEAAVKAQLLGILKTPEVVAQTLLELKDQAGITQQDVIETFQNFEELWHELFPAEQERIIKLLVKSVTVFSENISIELYAESLPNFMRELYPPSLISTKALAS